MVYSALFGAGSFLYGKMPQGFAWLAVFCVSTVGLVRILPGLWSSAPAHAGDVPEADATAIALEAPPR